MHTHHGMKTWTSSHAKSMYQFVVELISVGGVTTLGLNDASSTSPNTISLHAIQPKVGQKRHNTTIVLLL